MSSLEDQAAERKARLAALRNKRKLSETESSFTETIQPIQKKSSVGNNNQSTSNFQLKSRNFNPETKTEIKGFDAPPTALDENSETVEAVSQKIQDEVLLKFRQIANEVNEGLNKNRIKPRSLAWDMQRDIEEDLDLMKEKTDDVIKSIVKERIRKLREQSTTQED